MCSKHSCSNSLYRQYVCLDLRKESWGEVFLSADCDCIISMKQRRDPDNSSPVFSLISLTSG